MSSKDTDRRTLIKDLLILTGRSASSLAAEIGINRSGVTHWLKHGGTSIGIEKQDELLSRMGVVGGTLSPEIVHVWNLKTGELLPLARVLSWAGGRPYKIFSLRPSSPKKLDSYFDPRNWSLTNYPLLICSSFPPIKIVFRHRTPTFLPVTQIQLTDPVLVQTGLAEWVKIFIEDYPEMDKYFFKIVDKLLYDDFLKEVIPLEKFEQVWNSVSAESGAISTIGESDKTPNTWEELVLKAKSKGISLQEASEKLLGRGEGGT